MRRSGIVPCAALAISACALVAAVAEAPTPAPAPTAAPPAAEPPSAPGGRARMLVACAPGYPGTTAVAQPTMDRFAASAEKEAGWKPGGLGAVYHETLEGGVERLAAPDAVLALVTLPFYLEEGEKLGLKPRLQVVQESGATQIWCLVAKKGLVTAPAGLDGWELTGGVGFSPRFVRGIVAGEWGPLPESARITFGTSPLSALRRAASGEKTAVILEGAAVTALQGLPFGTNLEIVARSRPLPGSLLCAVGDRLPAREIDRMIKALSRMHESPQGAEELKAIQVTRFEPIDRQVLEGARRSFAGSPGAAH
jgi:hypothetical protein